MDVGILLPPHFGLSWERWRHILALTERLGFQSLVRSDHYFTQVQAASLEAYTSLALAARETQRLRLGVMVTPVTFRQPLDVARMAAQIDLLSGGRFVLGLGAGWFAPEHEAYGLPYPSLRERFDRLEEALQLMRALWSEGPTDFNGRFYRLNGADCLPKPARGRPPILIGGDGERRTLPLTAKYADEWNTVLPTLEMYAHKAAVLGKQCEAIGRDPGSIRRSVEILGVVEPSAPAVEELKRALSTLYAGSTPTAEQTTAPGIFTSTDEVIDYAGRLADLGADEVHFQHILFHRDEVLEYLAADIAPKLAAL